MSPPVNSNDNAKPPSLSPTAATYWVMLRQIILILAGTTLGVKYFPPQVVAYITDPNNWHALGLEVAGAISLGYGLYRSLRGPTIKATATLPGATVVLDNHAEAEAIKN